jgi:hypothetical protein
MLRGASAERPVKQPLGLLDGQIVNGCVAVMHDALGVVLPVLVAVGAIPLPGIVVRFVGETHGNPGAVESSQFLYKAILQLTIPFARQVLNDFLAAIDEF